MIATRFFERIGQDWQTVEGTLSIDAGCEGDGGFGTPHGIELDRPERVADNASEYRQVLLADHLSPTFEIKVLRRE
ncbi:MAG: hypothetical protein MUF18_14215 [Fimbriiglobus sp.]|nr:hypothetical protein [Fimbriiglobus sp.]